MADRDTQSTSHDETIIPVKPGVSRVRASAPLQPTERKRDQRLLVGAAFAFTVLVAAVVVFLLPIWVAEREPEEPVAAEPVEAAPAESSGPILSAEELEALRAEAEELLAELLTQQARLDELAAAEWGEAAWETYQERSRAGDDAYLANAFQDAVPAYAGALEIGGRLLDRSAELVEAALSAGFSALEAGNASLALEQFRLALGIDASNSEAQVGLARAETLPEVLVLVQQGDEHERQGRLEDAADAFRQALDLDPLWAPARSALGAVSTRIANQRFDRLMSEALSALAAEDFDDAYELFGDALILRPDSTEVRDGQTQAEQGRMLDEIRLTEVRAIAFEDRELWDRAIGLYGELLEQDPTLVFAQEGFERARRRSDLDAKLVNLIGNPTLLFDDRVLADAGLLLADARSIDSPGPRLQEQIADLDRIVVLASTPLTVGLSSDELTDVTLFRVGQLGKFAVTEVELRPGRYTAQGQRNGYQDVRETFLVLPGQVPGQDLPPVDVRCVQPIG